MAQLDGPTSSRNELLEKVMEFCIGSQFERDFENFAAANAHIFLDAGILEMDDKAEFPLSFHDVYLDYLRKFEGKIERFIESTGNSLQDFMQQAREILEESDTYGAQRFFLEALLATSEYESFITLMKGEMHKKDGDAGEGKDVGSSHK